MKEMEGQDCLLSALLTTQPSNGLDIDFSFSSRVARRTTLHLSRKHSVVSSSPGFLLARIEAKVLQLIDNKIVPLVTGAT